MEKRIVGVGSCLVLVGMFAGGLSVTASGAQTAAQSNSSTSVQRTPAQQGDRSAVPAAVALKKSLTAGQQQALSALMDRFKPQLTAIAAQLESSLAQGDSTKNQSSANASASIQADLNAAKGVFAQLKDVQAQIDRATASILSSEQFALHKQATSTLESQVLAKAQVTPTAAAGQSSALASDQKAAQAEGATESFSSSTCFAGGQYASIARYWAYYASSYAYTNYVYYDSDSNAYYANLYLSYAQSYAKTALQDLGGDYFNLTQLGSDFNGLGSAGASAAYSAYYYAYYGYLSAYNNYYYSGGGSYAYYAYVYGSYAYSNGVKAYNYGLYCS